MAVSEASGNAFFNPYQSSLDNRRAEDAEVFAAYALDATPAGGGNAFAQTANAHAGNAAHGNATSSPSTLEELGKVQISQMGWKDFFDAIIYVGVDKSDFAVDDVPQSNTPHNSWSTGPKPGDAPISHPRYTPEQLKAYQRDAERSAAAARNYPDVVNPHQRDEAAAIEAMRAGTGGRVVVDSSQPPSPARDPAKPPPLPTARKGRNVPQKFEAMPKEFTHGMVATPLSAPERMAAAMSGQRTGKELFNDLTEAVVMASGVGLLGGLLTKAAAQASLTAAAGLAPFVALSTSQQDQPATDAAQPK